MEDFRQACKQQIQSIKLDLEKSDNLKEKQINKLLNLTKDTPIIKEHLLLTLDLIETHGTSFDTRTNSYYSMAYNIQDLKIILIHFYYIK